MRLSPALAAILVTAIALPLAAAPSVLRCRYPDCSPDAKTIVFSCPTEGGWQLRTITLDGTAAALPTVEGDATEPDWSPDGKQIAFTWARDGNKDVAVMDLSSGESRVVAEGPTTDRSPSWSPDGQRIAFCSDRDGSQDIYVVTVGGGEVVRLTTDPAADTAPAWSPDGKTIAFCSGRDGISQLYFMAPDGSDQRLALAAYATSPDWEPGGKRIVFAGEPPDPDPMGPLPRSICVLDVAAGTVSRLECAARGSDPSWSADGMKIALTISGRLYVVAADGGSLTELSPF